MKKIFFILFLFSGVFFLWNLGGTYLTNWDEAWYAGISRNMLQRGDFVTPFWNNAPYFDKGPLYHWFSVFFYQIIPNWEWAARIPSALAGIGCVLLVFLLGKTLFNQKVGFMASLILASTIGFLFRARTGNFDAMVVFLLLASFLFFFLARKNSRYFLGLGISLGLLFLTKSAFVFYPFMIFLVFSLWERNLRFYKNISSVLGLLFALLIPGIWLFLGVKEAGKPFFDFYLNLLFWPFSKFGSANEMSAHFSLKYLSYLFYGTKLWFFPFIPAFFFTLRKAFKDSHFLFLNLAFFPYFLILLFTKEAGDWYLLPLYPIAALIIGVFLVWLQDKIFPQKIFASLLIALIFFMAISQNLYFRSLFITPETLKNEVELSRLAKELTKPAETIIVDDYYFPVASFYSERKIKVVRREAQDTALALSRKSLYQLLTSKERVFLLTTSDNFAKIKNDLPKILFKIEKQQDSHLLLTKP